MSNSQNLEILAHARSDAAAYFTALTLPAAGAYTDPNDVAATAGNGLAIEVPTWANTALMFFAYADSASGTPGLGGINVDSVWVGPAVGSPLVAMSPILSIGSVDFKGATLLVANIGGAATIGARISEGGNPTHPGDATVTVVFSRS